MSENKYFIEALDRMCDISTYFQSCVYNPNKPLPRKLEYYIKTCFSLANASFENLLDDITNKLFKYDDSITYEHFDVCLDHQISTSVWIGYTIYHHIIESIQSENTKIPYNSNDITKIVNYKNAYVRFIKDGIIEIDEVEYKDIMTASMIINLLLDILVYSKQHTSVCTCSPLSKFYRTNVWSNICIKSHVLAHSDNHDWFKKFKNVSDVDLCECSYFLYALLERIVCTQIKDQNLPGILTINIYKMLKHHIYTISVNILKENS